MRPAGLLRAQMANMVGIALRSLGCGLQGSYFLLQGETDSPSLLVIFWDGSRQILRLQVADKSDKT